MSERVHRESDDEADPTALDRLESARKRLAEAETTIEAQGSEAVSDAAAAYREATTLLDNYVDRATGTGKENFQAYIELEGQFATLVEGLSDDLADKAAFEDALEAIDKRRLSESDFERAHDALEPAKQYDDLLQERQAAREAVTEARKAANRRVQEIDDAIDERERLLELADADLDAPVEELRDPIETYNDAIRTAFVDYRQSASAREVFGLLDQSRWFPFVEYEQPPTDLYEFVMDDPAGEYTIPELLEYADYSRSKLSHYVADADELKRKVATQQTYLDGIDADPLTIDWPPGPAPVLRRRTREFRPFVDRVADEETVATLRAVGLWTRESDYDRLQTAAQAVDQLTPAERDRLSDGRIEDELESLQAERDRLEDALEADDPS